MNDQSDNPPPGSHGPTTLSDLKEIRGGFLGTNKVISYVAAKHKGPEEISLEWVPTSDWAWLKGLIAGALPRKKTWKETIFDPTKIPTYLVSAGITSSIAGVIAFFNARSLMTNVMQLIPDTHKPSILPEGPTYPWFFVFVGITFIILGLLWSLAVPRPEEPQANKAQEALNYMTKIETQATTDET